MSFLFVVVGFLTACAVEPGQDGEQSRSVEAPAADSEAAAPNVSQPTPRDLVDAAVSTGDDLSAHTGVIQGAEAVNPEAVGTIVAHAAVESVTAYEQPDPDSPVVQTFANPTDRGGPLVFQGVDQQGDWLEVLLPIRPNGTTGWVRADDLSLSINPYRIEIDADAFELTIYRYGEEKLTTTIAIGNGDTPTPIGQFYLIELLRPSNPDGAYGPYAYGLSGYSDTLESFNGGEGVIGIHGTNRPEHLGQEVSHGCVRVANDVISDMTDFLPLGTPVIITRDDT